MLKERAAGVLMHISSLPSSYGIGVFDRNCLHFADRLCEMNFRYWQVLPFNPVDGSNSPYCSSSAFAGNYMFIDPEALYADGLCTKEEFEDNIYNGSPYTADYAFAAEKRLRLLKSAFSRITPELAVKIKEFEDENGWLTDFSLYMSLKEANGMKPWWEWETDFARYEIFIKEHRYDFEERSAFWKFVQYVFFTQWKKVKEYINSKGIAVIGDMPIYVSLDSADVWANRDLFLIDDKTLKPQKVAGVPPDYFSKDGQLWGNPLYDWERMEKDGFSWWLDRIGAAISTYDVVRIDHFRAFASFWQVPADSETAREGEWAKGPGMKLFDRVFEKYPDTPIIAEDLGVFGDDVVELLEATDFPGMKVIQFGFDEDCDSSHLPHNAVKNSVNYVGTHDNNTLLGWLWEADKKSRLFALDYCGFKNENWGDGGFHSQSCRAIIETVWKSVSNTVIIAFQDLCGFGSDARMNIPGVADKNWRFRTTEETVDAVDTAYYKKINRIFKRDYKVL